MIGGCCKYVALTVMVCHVSAFIVVIYAMICRVSTSLLFLRFSRRVLCFVAVGFLRSTQQAWPELWRHCTRGLGSYTTGTVNSRATFKSGTERRRFSVSLLMTWCHRIDFPKSKLNTELYIFCCTGRRSAPNCTDLHLYFQKFPGGNIPGPILRRGQSPLQTLPSARVHLPTFRELPRSLYCTDRRSRIWRTPVPVRGVR